MDLFIDKQSEQIDFTSSPNIIKTFFSIENYHNLTPRARLVFVGGGWRFLLNIALPEVSVSNY